MKLFMALTVLFPVCAFSALAPAPTVPYTIRLAECKDGSTHDLGRYGGANDAVFDCKDDGGLHRIVTNRATGQYNPNASLEAHQDDESALGGSNGSSGATVGGGGSSTSVHSSGSNADPITPSSGSAGGGSSTPGANSNVYYE